MTSGVLCGHLSTKYPRGRGEAEVEERSRGRGTRMIEKEIIKTKYGNIAAYKKGSGPKTILLLHGAGCDSTMLSWR